MNKEYIIAKLQNESSSYEVPTGNSPKMNVKSSFSKHKKQTTGSPKEVRLNK